MKYIKAASLVDCVSIQAQVSGRLVQQWPLFFSAPIRLFMFFPSFVRRLLGFSAPLCFLLLGLALFLSLSGRALAATPAAWPVTVLSGQQLSPTSVRAGVWVDETGQQSLAQVLQKDAFAPFNPYHNYALGRDGAVWLRLRVQMPASAQPDAAQAAQLMPWVLEIPVPLLDEVTLYQTDSQGKLLAQQQAGDLLANARWSYPSSLASFKLNLLPGQTQDLWLRVKYPLVVQLPIHLKSERQFLYDSRLYFWSAGTVMGSLLFLTLYVAVMALAFKDWTHLSFGLYLFTTLATLFAYSGINGYLGWVYQPRWVDISVAFWQFLSAASSLFFVGVLLQVQHRWPALGRWMQLLAALCVLAIPVYALVDRAMLGGKLLAILLTLSYAVNLCLAILAWKKGDATGRWLSAFFAILLCNVLGTGIAIAFEWQVFWHQKLLIYVFLALSLPLILAQMNFKMRHELAMQIRAQGMRSHDALTDTLKEAFFLARLRTIMASARKRKGSALVLIDISNLPFMRASFAPEVIEQTLLRAVIKIKRIFGEVDAMGRIGDHCIAVLLENADRDRVSKLAVELIASGLMPSKNAKQDITIVFHFAVALLDDYAGDADADALLAQLQALCSKMSPRTQRPIRYLNAVARSASGDSSSSDSKGLDPSSTSFLPSALSAAPAANAHAAGAWQPAASTLPPGLHSSSHPSSGASASTSFRQ